MSTKITISPVKIPGDKYTYRVKVVNQERKSEFIMDKLSDTHRFKSMDELRHSLMDHLKFQVETLGYIEPGHGLRGKQQWLNRESDLDDMYECTKQRKEVTLWCYRPNENLKPSRKRACSERTDPPAKAKRETCARRTDEVEDIICSLKQKHDKKFTMEQMSCWAHLYRMGKHSSLDDPPNLPFFTGYKNKPVQSATEKGPAAPEKGSLSSSTVANQPPVNVSPPQKIQMRGESIKQLADWHSLLKQGIVSQEQYEEIQSVILKDMKENFA